MKRLLVALMLVGTLVATGAFAATFNINGNAGQENQQNIGAADADVEFCNHNVEVNIDGEFVDGSGYEVSYVDIDADPACADWTVSVTLTQDGNSLAESTATLNGNGDAILDFSGDNVAVADVNDVHVQIDNVVGPIVP